MEQVPGKHAGTIIRSRNPLNSGSPLASLIKSYITPTSHFYVRNHAPIPAIEQDGYHLTVSGPGQAATTFSLSDLRSLPSKTVTATLQCAGNRRSELSSYRLIDDQVQWGAEAISNGVWTGVSLKAVLEAAGLASSGKHVAFTGLDDLQAKGRQFGFGGSIPIDKALSPEVLLSYEMNGQPLTPTHGAPLRVVVPGYIAARSVKWLGRIDVQDEPSDNHFQARAYKIFPPHIDANTADWDAGLMLGELSVTAVMCNFAEGDSVAAGSVEILGYAMAGGNRTVERVDISSNAGHSWQSADFIGDKSPWAWQLFRAELNLSAGRHHIVARAWDSAANTQPEDIQGIWNFKGYMNNSWHRISLDVTV